LATSQIGSESPQRKRIADKKQFLYENTNLAGHSLDTERRTWTTELGKEPTSLPDVRLVSIDEIRSRPESTRLRGVEQLMRSISINGLINLPTLDPDFVFIAGAGRIEATERLGWKKIPAIVLPKALRNMTPEEQDKIRELVRLDENFVRQGLSSIDECVGLAEQKAIYLHFFPQTKQGGAQGKAGGGKVAKREAISSFATSIALATKVTTRTVRYRVSIGKELGFLVDRIRKVGIEKLSQLKKLSDLDSEERVKVLILLEGGQAGSVEAAIEQLEFEGLTNAAEVFESKLYDEDYRTMLYNDSSVDMILTAPSSTLSSTSWNDVAKFSARVIKQGCCLAAFVPVQSLPSILNTLSQHLNYVGMIAVIRSKRIVKKVDNTDDRWKPLVIFSKGKERSHPPFDDVCSVESISQEQLLKSAETLLVKLIRTLTDEKGTIVDPLAIAPIVSELAHRAGRVGVCSKPPDENSEGLDNR